MKKEELVQLLIRLVIEQADASRGNFGKGYYLLNYHHPIVWELYNRSRQAHQIPEGVPMGDKDRLNFELSLFNSGMLKQIDAWCGRQARENNNKERGTVE